ncbi:MAG: DUF5615 family PIN-like protein [Gemmataceae bacterium]|nr:DUF5615 family PIN-like protein [Gemmataceae bacterium]
MNPIFLLDEQLPRWWRGAIIRLEPQLRVLSVGDPGAPRSGSADPEILVWCEENQCFLITNNRHSMPVHLADHIAGGRHVPGIFVENPKRSIREVAGMLALIDGAAFAREFEDQIRHLTRL